MKKILLSFSMVLIIMTGFGQTISPENNWQKRFFDSSEAVLPLLISTAITHSAEIEKAEATKKYAQLDIQTSKYTILNGLAFNTGYHYGTTTVVTSDQLNQPNQVNAFALPARAQYTVGLGFQLPFDRFFGRKNEVSKKETVVKQVEAERKIAEREIRKEVIGLYQDVVFARIVWTLRQDALQSADINKKIAEKRFNEGQIKVDEQIATMNFYSKAVEDNEEAKSRYLTAYLLLEERIGTTINNLMTAK